MKLKKIRLAAVLTFSSIILMACSNPFDELADDINNALGLGSSSEEESNDDTSREEGAAEDEEETTDEEVAGEEPDGEPVEETDEETDPMYETIDYSHLYGEGEEVTLEEGDHAVGNDVVPGRYSITTTSEYGSYLSIYDEEDRYVAGESLMSEDGEDDFADYPTELLVYLSEGDNIEITNDESFTLTPVSTEYEDELPAGMHVAGHDIEAGDYRISTDETDRVGQVETAHAEAYVTSRNAVGNPDEGGRESFVMTIEEGDIVRVIGMDSVNLEKLD